MLVIALFNSNGVTVSGLKGMSVKNNTNIFIHMNVCMYACTNKMTEGYLVRQIMCNRANFI